MVNHSLFDEKINYDDFLKQSSKLDVSFRAIFSNTDTCLILNDNKEDIQGSISEVFNKIFSFQIDQKTFVLPFENEFFDLVVFSKLDLKNDEEIERCFQDIKRVMKPSGCFCVIGKNSSGLDVLNKKSSKDNIKFYSNNYNGYLKIFNKLGFKIRPYWIIGNFDRPQFIGSIENVEIFRWFFSNIDKFLVIKPKLKFVIWSLKKIKFCFSRKFIKIISPSFLFYCYKNTVSEELEIMIEKKTDLKNMLQQIRLTKNIFILFDDKGNPKKRLLCKRKKINPADEIFTVNGPPKNDIFQNKLVLVDWVEGRKADFNNSNDLKLIYDWLMDFQSSTSGSIFEENLIKQEISDITNELYKKNDLERNQIEKWLLDYFNQINELKVKTSGVHGDFAPHNIIIEENESSLHVIDWDTYLENGSPFYDIGQLIYHVLTPNSSVDEFISNIKNSKENEKIQLINNLLFIHFNKKINLITILRYYFLRDLAFNKELNDEYFISLLRKLSKFDEIC